MTCKKTLRTVGAQDTGRRQAHIKHRKHKQNGTQLKPGMNQGILEVLAKIVFTKTPVKLFKMCWSPLCANIPKKDIRPHPPHTTKQLGVMEN